VKGGKEALMGWQPITEMWDWGMRIFNISILNANLIHAA
jgi:hypothetical protein